MSLKIRNVNPRDIIIAILSVLVLVEAYFLFFRPKKMPPAAVHKKPVAVAVKEIKERPVKGRIAIIIDDWGYNVSHCELLRAIDGPVTVSILPQLPHSQEVAECAHRNGKEVMLHLPLEPQPRENLEKYPRHYIIKTSMKKTEVEKMLEEALKSVPFADGINNHMGSKATEDTRLMTTVFTFLQKKGLFFVDSLVTNHSVCRDLARTMSLPFAHRDIFLDNTNNRSYIESQFNQLIETATQKGTAIGIGHDRALTLEVIDEQIQKWEKEGFQFVTVRNLITKQ